MRERVLLRLHRLFFLRNNIAIVLAVAGVGVLGVLTAAHAFSATDTIANIVGSLVSSLAQLVIELVGKLFVVLIDILLAVVQYNDFINAPAVVKAWVLIRDFANMAFLIIFIAIAFATILGVEKYEYKQLLPKLLLMAVAINFSRTICGIVLDAAQVVMMTFVNGFKDVAAGNLIRGFGLTDLLTLNSGASLTDARPVDNTSLAIASVLAVVILIISAIVVGVIVFMFLIRVIYLWILIILSPLAFLMAATPGMSGKFSEWWGQFVKYAMVGPILAFFLWLSFSIMASVKPTENLAQSSGFMSLNPDQNISAAITTVSNSGNLLSFGIAIALLIMSLTVAQSLGVKGGQLAGAALSKIQSGGVKLAKLGALGVATGGGLAVAGYLGYRGGKAVADTRVGKWAGRRLDEKVSPWLTKGIGKIGKKVFKDKTSRLGMASAKLAETGILLRTLPESWKARAESREKTKVAPYAGGGRDVFHALIDKEDKNYAFRNKMALDAEEAKKQRDETDGTSEAYLNIAFNALRAGKTNSKDIRGALMNVWGQNDQNEITLSREIYGKNKKGEDVTFGEEIHNRVVNNLEKAIGEDGVKNAEAYLAAQEKLRQAIAAGADDATLENIKESELKPARQKLSTLEYEYAKEKPLKASDSPFARQEALKMFLGTEEKDKEGKVTGVKIPDDAAKFAARLTGVALENRNYASFGLAGSTNGEYSMTDLYREEGFEGYNKAVMGKMRNINPPELWRAHPSSFRNEVIDGNDMRTYDDDFNSVGNNLLILAAPGISERNLNLRPDASGAVMATMASRQYPDLLSSDPARRTRAYQDYADDNLVGYNYSLGRFVSPEAHTRTVSGYLQRQGSTPDDLKMTPRQTINKLTQKLPQRQAELKPVKDVFDAAEAAFKAAKAAKVSEAEIARLQAELDTAKAAYEPVMIDVNRIKEQIARFWENINIADLDTPPPSDSSRGGGGGNGAPATPAATGPTIALPGSAEFNAVNENLRNRRT